MIQNIFELLKMAKYSQSENIKIAKGKNHLPENWLQFKKALNNIKER